MHVFFFVVSSFLFLASSRPLLPKRLLFPFVVFPSPPRTTKKFAVSCRVLSKRDGIYVCGVLRLCNPLFGLRCVRYAMVLFRCVSAPLRVLAADTAAMFSRASLVTWRTRRDD